jgi:uncharacterized membrane protein
MSAANELFKIASLHLATAAAESSFSSFVRFHSFQSIVLFLSLALFRAIRAAEKLP